MTRVPRSPAWAVLETASAGAATGLASAAPASAAECAPSDERLQPSPPGAVRAPGSPSRPAEQLARLGLRPRKRLSQSFLTDRRVAAAVARAALLESGDAVLEIGAGLGILTAELVRRAGRVVAVELDARLADALPALLGDPPNLSVVQADALALDPAARFAGAYKVVANLPYHITSPLLLRLLTLPRPPSLLVVMVQREVAERIAARPGDLSYLAVAVQLYAVPEIIRVVPPKAFYPRPKVESAVLRLTVRPAPAVAQATPDAFLRFVQAGFKQPRKQLHNSLAEGLGWRPDAAGRLLAQVDVDPARRAQSLTMGEWERVFQAFGAPADGRSWPDPPTLTREGDP